MSHKPKKAWIAPAGATQSDINITPLVDVVLVLLIIFMVVTPLLEKDIAIQVPDLEKTPQPNNAPPPDQLVVRVDPQGKIFINTQEVNSPEYIERIKKLIDKKKKGEKVVFIIADDSTNYGSLVLALDGARQAGAEILGMMTEQIK